MKYIVYEYTEKASPQYQGCRFMTAYYADNVNPNVDGRLKVVKEDIDEAEAQALCEVTAAKSIMAFILDMPIELFKLKD